MTVLRWGEFGEVAVGMMVQVKPDENLYWMCDIKYSEENAQRRQKDV
jgi:hypothetical protein